MAADVEGTADVVLSVAVADGIAVSAESLRVVLDGDDVAVREVLDNHGTRLHVATRLTSGRLEVEYHASVIGTAAPSPVNEVDVIRYGRPSRYCESDRLAAFARAEFRGLTGLSLLESVSSWVGMRVAYISGSSRSTDGAVATLLARQGVCRDFAHLVIGLLRGCDTPARLVSVYAPGLQPMDFHAIAEAHVDGRWLAVDATCLAPRSTMVRIATGRDAADTAFLTASGDPVELISLDVTAITDEALPDDDLTRPAELG